MSCRSCRKTTKNKGMKMAISKLNMNVKLKWWVVPFMNSLLLIKRITGWQPDEKLIGKIVVERGLKITGPDPDV